MKYMGSKNRIAKYILPIILKDRKEGQWYVEPFVGGANLIDKVGGNRLGSDSNEYLISLYHSLQDGYVPKEFITREEFYEIKANKELYSKEEVALCGILASYNGNWFRAYGGCSSTKNGAYRNYYAEGVRNMKSQLPSILEVAFVCKSYSDLKLNKPCIIYCDPPYESTDKTYKEKNFDYVEFWEWCREMSNFGHLVFVSSFVAPEDFECLWKMEVQNTHPNQKKKSTEKLFRYNPTLVTK